MRSGFLITLLVLTLVLPACHPVISPVRPDEYYDASALPPPVSTLNVPLDLDIKKFEKVFNAGFRGLIYSDTSFRDNDNDGLKIKAYKQGDVLFSIQGSQLSYQVPLYVVLEKQFRVGAFGFSVSDVREATAGILLKFKTSLSVHPDWSVSSYTMSDGYEWVSTPSLRLGSVSVPLPVISDILLKDNLPVISRGIDESLKSYLDLKTLAGEAWTGIQEPILVSESPSLWLLVIPVGASTTPIRGSGTTLKQMIGLRVSAELIYGPKPERAVNPDLPELKITSRIDEGLKVSLLADLPFAEINQEANRQLAGKIFTEGKYTVRIEDVSLFGNGGNLIVAAGVSGSIEGTIYLAGQPWFDKATSSLRVRNIDFDVQTKNVLVRSASWLLHGGITSKIADALTFPADSLFEQARSELQSYLTGPHPYGYFSASGTIDRLDIERILITRSSIRVQFGLGGNVYIELSDN